MPVIYDELWAAMRANYDAGNVKWVETTEEMYDEMLNILPPEEWEHGSFLVGEPWSHTMDGDEIYGCFLRYDERYYARYLTRKQWRIMFKKCRKVNHEICELEKV